MKKLTIILLVISISSMAQMSKKELKKSFLKAYGAMQYDGFAEALKELQRIEKHGQANANIYYNIGLCYLNMPGDKSRAIPYLTKASSDVSLEYRDGSYKEKQAPVEAVFYLAKAYRIAVKLDKAMEMYEKYRTYLSADDIYYQDFIDLQIKTCKTAKELFSHPVRVRITNLGKTINNSDDNINPCITNDGKTMVYTNVQTLFDKETKEETFYESLRYTTFENGQWKKPTNITSKINSDGYASTVGLSNDGKTILLFMDDFGDGNIYMAKKMGYRFSEMEKLSKNINSRDWESSASITSDGKTIYFASNRKGGIGGRDIYTSTINEKGKWGKPKNLGKTINTEFEENCPVISEDGNTLYFSSEAHNSMGGYDVFVSTKDNSGNWSTPLNLGYPINTTADDLFFYPYQNGKYALFSMEKPDDSFGKKDIYQMQLKFDEGEELPPLATNQYTKKLELANNTKSTIQNTSPTNDSAKLITENTNTTNDSTKLIAENSSNINNTTEQIKENKNTTTEKTDIENQETTKSTTTTETKPVVVKEKTYDIRGLVLLQDKKQPNQDFKIKVKNTSTGIIVGTTTPDNNGQYSVTVKPGKYIVTYEGSGYTSLLKPVTIPKNYALPKITLDVEMTPKKVSSGEYVIQRGILFNYNSSQLTNNAKRELEKVYRMMKENPNLYIELTGYTDPAGTTAYNKALSSRRVRSAVNYLTNKNIAKKRFITKAMGESEPIVPETANPEAQKYNRRVEINISNPGNAHIKYVEFQIPESLTRDKSYHNMKYTVLLTDSKKSLPLNYFTKVEKQGVANVWVFESRKGYLYSIGKYATRTEAASLLNKAVDMGFPNAKIINFKELEKRREQGQFAAMKKLKEIEQKNGEYTIQLIALKIPVDVSYFTNLSGVKRIKCSDGFYRYTWSKFNYKTALLQRSKLIDAGYPCAFIVKNNSIK